MSQNRKLNVLAIGAHYDDIELGCAGSLRKYVTQGHNVYMIVVTKSNYTNHDGTPYRTEEQADREGKNAAKIIGVKELRCLDVETKHVKYGPELIESLNSIIDELNIDIIFTHWQYDVHQDHSAIGKATLNAGRHSPRILMYRSNWYQTTESFRDNFYIEMTDYVDIKKESLIAHEVEFARRGMKWVDFVLHKNKNSGLEIGVEYAEAFECVKWLDINYD